MGTTARARRGVPLWAILLALIVIALAIYPGWQRITKIFRPTKVAVNDCQQDHLVIYKPEGDSITGVDLPLIGPIADLPEFHDCQRFLVPDGRSITDGGSVASAPGQDGLAYGPLVAIWAANKLGERLPLGVRETDSLRGLVSDSEHATTGIRELAVMAVPVAVIYDFERRVGYEPLAINPGFSCLYVWKAEVWQARIVSLGADPSPCLEPMDTTSRTIVGGTPLQVTPSVLPLGLGPEDVPPVARWDWDGTQQYIGIRCGDEWCEIGRVGSTTSVAESATAVGAAMLVAVEDIPIASFTQATDIKKRRVVAVKGWYDQQRLDVRDANGHLQLTDIVGTAIPHPSLDKLAASSFERKWIPAAYLHVTGDYPGKVKLTAGMNRVYMCKGTARECTLPEGTKACSDWDQDPGDPWWAKIVSAAGDSTFHCVRRRTHGGLAIPAAAARWNWHELDATTWVQCGTACCTVN